MEPAVGAWCTGSEVCFRLRDHDQRLSGVRLHAAVFEGTPEFGYLADSRIWELRQARPAVRRIEYKLELAYPDGGTEKICDPDNPRRVVVRR